MENQKLVIETSTLQELVGKAVKGCSFVDVIPITGWMQLRTVNKEDSKYLEITTTDNVNFLTLRSGAIESSDFHIVVNAKLFSSLVGKLTTQTTSLLVDGNKLVVKANGVYNIELCFDMDGSAITFPCMNPENMEEQSQLNNLNIKSILTLNKSCKAEMKEVPALYNYYMDSERILTTDFYRVCTNPVKAFNNPTCLTPELVELIPTVADDNGVKISCNDTDVMIYSSKGTLFGKKCVQDDVDQYPVQDLVSIISEKLNYSCKINRTLLINALDRICLFTQLFESNMVNVKFTKENLTLGSSTNAGNEVISYLSPINNEEDINFNCNLDGAFLKNQLTSCTREDITLNFGSDNGIQIVCDNVILTLGSLDEEV